MKITFLKQDVKMLLKHSKTSQFHFPADEDHLTDRPGLLLVGDQGIYLMSNGKPALKIGEKDIIVHAQECNPLSMKFEDWWEAKRRIFGVDDGVLFISAEQVQVGLDSEGAYFIIDINPDSDEIIIEE